MAASGGAGEMSLGKSHQPTIAPSAENEIRKGGGLRPLRDSAAKARHAFELPNTFIHLENSVPRCSTKQPCQGANQKQNQQHS